jgi:transposase
MSTTRRFGTEISGNARRKEIDQPTRGAVYALFSKGVKSAAEIATEYGISKSSVYYIAKRFKKTGSFEDRPRVGRPTTLTDRQKRAILQAARKEPFRTLKDLRNVIDPPPSEWTIRKVLAEGNLYSYVAQKGPLLTAAHRRARLEFARKFRGKVPWPRLIFSDEASFTLGRAYGRQYVRREPGRGHERKYLRQQSKSYSTKMFWGAIALNAKSRLILVQGHMDSVKYTDVLKDGLLNVIHELEELFGTAGQEGGPTVFFQQDNAPPHSAKATAEFFERKGVNIFAKWPASSPDLNPIEHVWAMLKKRVSTLIEERQLVFTQAQASKEEFCALVQKTWDEIAQEELHPLILSMDERLDAVIKAKGGHTRF